MCPAHIQTAEVPVWTEMTTHNDHGFSSCYVTACWWSSWCASIFGLLLPSYTAILNLFQTMMAIKMLWFVGMSSARSYCSYSKLTRLSAKPSQRNRVGVLLNIRPIDETVPRSTPFSVYIYIYSFLCLYAVMSKIIHQMCRYTCI